MYCETMQLARCIQRSDWVWTYLHDNSPVKGDVPVLSHANKHIHVPGKLVSRVESDPPEAAHECAFTEESWAGNGRCSGCEDRDERAEDEKGETDTGASSWCRSVCDADAKALGNAKTDGEDEVCGPADLVGDVAAAVE